MEGSSISKAYNLTTMKEEKNTQEINAKSREKIADFRSLILDSDLLKEVLTMAVTGYNCVVKDGELVINREEILSEDVRFKYAKLLIDKSVSSPKEVEEEKGERSPFLKQMDIQQNLLDQREKEKYSDSIQVISPEVLK